MSTPWVLLSNGTLLTVRKCGVGPPLLPKSVDLTPPPNRSLIHIPSSHFSKTYVAYYIAEVTTLDHFGMTAD